MTWAAARGASVGAATSSRSSTHLRPSLLLTGRVVLVELLVQVCQPSLQLLVSFVVVLLVLVPREARWVKRERTGPRVAGRCHRPPTISL